MLRATFNSQTVSWATAEECIRQSPYRIRKTPITQAAKDPSSDVTVLGQGHALTPMTMITFS